MYETGVGGEPTEPLEVIHGPVEARYTARCLACEDDIRPGGMIVKLSTDRWVHDRAHCRT